MTQYVGCEHARELLDGLVDGELSMADQLAVESHLRWCRTCALRVEDMRLIGTSMRMGAAAVTGRGDDAAVASVTDAVLMRVRAEREQSYAVRMREMFADMRFLWPALGATAAVVVCVGVAAGVLQAATAQKPQSLAALIATLATPGSERNPLRPANTGDPLRDERFGISIPRLFADDAKRASGTLEDIPDEDVIYTIRTVVNRDGRISDFEVLLSDGERVGNHRAANRGQHARAVFDAVQQSRFAPAETPMGRAVAVDMVWVIAKTTAVVEPTIVVRAPAALLPRAKEAAKPPIVEPEPADRQSARPKPKPSTTA